VGERSSEKRFIWAACEGVLLREQSRAVNSRGFIPGSSLGRSQLIRKIAEADQKQARMENLYAKPENPRSQCKLDKEKGPPGEIVTGGNGRGTTIRSCLQSNETANLQEAQSWRLGKTNRSSQGIGKCVNIVTTVSYPEGGTAHPGREEGRDAGEQLVGRGVIRVIREIYWLNKKNLTSRTIPLK